MSKFFFYPVLDALGDGRIIRKGVSTALQVLAVLDLLGGAYLLVEILKAAFQMPTDGTIGGLLFAVIFLGTVLAIAQILWYRAASVRNLGDSPFTVIPVVAVLLRTAGEVYATAGVSVGVGGCLFLWLAKGNPMGLLQGLGGVLPSASADASFLGGIMFLLYLSVASFFMLIVFYFLAESIVVTVDIARHVRQLVRQGAPGSSGGPGGNRCPKCSSELEPGARFCPACGEQAAAAAGA